MPKNARLSKLVVLASETPKVTQVPFGCNMPSAAFKAGPPSESRISQNGPYGLAAGLWTSDIGRALRGSAALEAGMVWVNTYRAVSYMAPFGGYKRSGLGRENGREAIDLVLVAFGLA